MAPGSNGTLTILHVLRAPVGGLFRHVLDLARGQAERGHRVGLIADSSTGGLRAEATIEELRPLLSLGISRTPMSRNLGLRDVSAFMHVARRLADCSADVIHGHGAKGGAYARLTTNRSAIRVYTPHGGSLHYDWNSPVGFLYLTLERALIQRTELFLFESAYGRDVFGAKVGNPKAATRVVHNGATAADFAPVTPGPDASDVLFVGELRMLKGIDVLIQALALLAREGRPATATIVGDGPDAAALKADVDARGLSRTVRFAGAMPARSAFALGRVLVVPSRAESLPYIVLEAAAAAVPLIVTRVGGIPEIFGPDASDLLAPGDPLALADAIRRATQGGEALRNGAARLQARVRTDFSAGAMTDAILAAYRDVLALPHG